MFFGPWKIEKSWNPINVPNPAAEKIFTRLDVRLDNNMFVMTTSTISMRQNWRRSAQSHFWLPGEGAICFLHIWIPPGIIVTCRVHTSKNGYQPEGDDFTHRR